MSTTIQIKNSENHLFDSAIQVFQDTVSLIRHVEQTLTTVLSRMNFLDSTIEISVGGTILHTKATTLRAGASHSPILQSIITAFEGQSDATTVGNGVWPQGCGYIPRASFVIDRDGCGWRHVMNYLRALELDCDAAEMAEMVGFVDWRERQAAAVEARWLGLFKLEELLSNMPEFTRQGLQAINPAPNNSGEYPYPDLLLFSTK